MELTQVLHRQCQRHPDKVVLVCGTRRRSWCELRDRTARLAAVLRSEGISHGERVAIWSTNSIEFIEACFACWWLGAVACPVNTRWSVAEIAESLRDCEAGLLLLDNRHAAQLAALQASGACPARLLLGEARVDSSLPCCEHAMALAEPLPDGRHGGDALAALLYTGGTTGRSKGVMLTHANLWCAAMSRLADNPPPHDSVVLLATPLFHVAALSRLLAHLLAGGSCVLVPQFEPEVVLDLVEQEGVTDLSLVPSMLQTLIDREGFSAQRLRSVQRLGYGAAPSAGPLLQRVQALLPWVGLSQAYGMTESAAIGTLSGPVDHDEHGWRTGRAASAGQACTGVELRVVDDTGHDLPQGEVGEILLRGPSVTPGYWRRPDETARVLRGGWLHTGDAGRLDESGRLHVVDRLKDMIISGGENIYCAEVEGAIASHPAVGQCAVIGLPDARWGESVHAVVVLRPALHVDEAALRSWCRERIAGYKCPRSVEFVDELPMTAAGKVAKHLLREARRRGGP
jgi:long-chain acyl-CoA synthetase